MDFFGRSTNVDGAPSERIVSRDIEQCPFLRNIGEPTSSCFSVLKFPLSVRVKGEKGPIFEEGPSFDTALRLFHGRDGVVPLSGRSSVSKPSNPEDEMGASSSQFHPLAAPAATISLSAFDPGGPFSFNYFMGKQEVPKQIKKKGDSRNKPNSSSSQNGHNHQGMGNEWLETGNCPIAKSYQAVSRVLPLVATVFQLPPGMKVRCPPAIVAARAALARTALAKSLRPKPLPSKMFAIGLLGMAANVPLGVWREHTEKFSPSWFVAIHAAIPFVAMLRKAVNIPKSAMVFTIAAAVLGQVIGSRAERTRIRSGQKTLSILQQQTSQYRNADVHALISPRAWVSEALPSMQNKDEGYLDNLKTSSASGDSWQSICA